VYVWCAIVQRLPFQKGVAEATAALTAAKEYLTFIGSTLTEDIDARLAAEARPTDPVCPPSSCCVAVAIVASAILSSLFSLFSLSLSHTNTLTLSLSLSPLCLYVRVRPRHDDLRVAVRRSSLKPCSHTRV
jgi:hypothetical protein